MNTCSFIFATILFLGSLSYTGAATCHPDDEAGLLTFKSGITRDPLGILRSWKKSTDCCQWNGVLCTSSDRVTELIVSGNSQYGQGILAGTISPSLAKLKQLERLSFIDVPKITGPFPKFIFQLPKLWHLYISNTSLSGPLPTSIPAPSELLDVTLENNRFTGPIPSSISNLTRLMSLNLVGNRLSGTIPDIFKSLTNLGDIRLSRNQLHGKLPPSLASLAPVLQILRLSQNNLSGTIPSYLSRCPELYILDLSWNQFSGVVPMSFANLTKLMTVIISHNLLTGPLPALKFYREPSSLELSYNQFQLKTIPKWVTSSSVINYLNLAKCGIKMSLDKWKPKSPNSFLYIDLSGNEISGSPASLLNRMESLVDFDVSGNKLRFDLGKLNFTNSLRSLDLSRNLVFGKVPPSVAGLDNLNLSQNHLCGKLPVTKFPASVFSGNDCLCGSPLSPWDQNLEWC